MIDCSRVGHSKEENTLIGSAFPCVCVCQKYIFTQKYPLLLDASYRNNNILEVLNKFNLYCHFQGGFSIGSDVKQTRKNRLKVFQISFSSKVTRFPAI